MSGARMAASQLEAEILTELYLTEPYLPTQALEDGVNEAAYEVAYEATQILDPIWEPTQVVPTEPEPTLIPVADGAPQTVDPPLRQGTPSVAVPLCVASEQDVTLTAEMAVCAIPPSVDEPSESISAAEGVLGQFSKAAVGSDSGQVDGAAGGGGSLPIATTALTALHAPGTFPVGATISGLQQHQQETHSCLSPLSHTPLGSTLPSQAAVEAKSQIARSLATQQDGSTPTPPSAICTTRAIPSSAAAAPVTPTGLSQFYSSGVAGASCGTTGGLESQTFRVVARMVEDTLRGCCVPCLQHRVLVEELQCAAAENDLDLLAHPEVLTHPPPHTHLTSKVNTQMTKLEFVVRRWFSSLSTRPTTLSVDDYR